MAGRSDFVDTRNDNTPAQVLGVFLGACADGGMMMIFVTREMGFARRAADCVVFMDEGEIAEVAPPSRFFESPHMRQLVWRIGATRRRILDIAGSDVRREG